MYRCYEGESEGLPETSLQGRVILLVGYILSFGGESGETVREGERKLKRGIV